MTATEMSKNEPDNSVSYFAERVKTLSKGDLTALRRAFSGTLTEASGAALAAFYKICPKDVKKEETAYLAACAIAYILHYGNGKKSFANCLKQAEVSESRVKALLSNKSIDRDGFFHTKYSRLVRYTVSKGYLPDINEIYPALSDWWKYRLGLTKEFFHENNK
ncbi:MAG: type I-E CRISPR-associated protein Cse2/CasB [Clostridia bacterium]|nr:type I-E CRISPR-associated protein Cse2/CasB [Clostridia bacterium]